MPRSGCSMISSAGMPAITPISATSTAPTCRRREFSVRSAMIIAIPITTASLANSAGWIERPPIISQERDPLIVVPMTQDQHQPDHRGDVDERSDDADPAVVGGHHRGSEHQADQDVDEVLVQVRRRVAPGEHVVARGGRPDQQGADGHDQPGRAEQEPVEPGDGDAAAGDREAASDGEDGHRFSPLLDGGRIEPSLAKVGNPAGALVPGIAALAGETFSPLIP